MIFRVLSKSIICVLLSALFLSSCGGSDDEPIPAKYSRNNENFSPPLEWTEPPAETQSMALICDDPDAPSGTWVHWVIYNLSSDVRSLQEAMPSDANLADDSSNGKNSWNELGHPHPAVLIDTISRFSH